MYPDIPYDGLSWPITQHAGVLSKDVVDGLLNACLLCNSEEVKAEIINEYLVQNGILTMNVRADSNQVDAWRDYQQILSEFGMIYSTRISKVIRLTPVAMAYLSHRISYEEMIALQVLRYQYPNGHKSQLSPSLKESYGREFNFDTFTEMQEECGILIRPAVMVWQILYELWQRGEQAVLSLDEMQRYVVRCLKHTDLKACCACILQSRHAGEDLPALTRARRNMSDWLKIMNQTPLFKLNTNGNVITLSSVSIRSASLIGDICKQMCNSQTFWFFKKDSFKKDWFDFYGDFDHNTDWIIKL
ncbi:hypothetical protein [Succiniclasticum ruminis]|uniref:AlwI restriction endonuclease n=1 Tax=Succiniclasticum ruminis DSM 9236 TaxID=1123323 RepID=A0A1I2BYZ5_9FIRM|nr:hypothetical protein [Succiniclasticum ruminis]SFE61361.1 hypothetical protein SAMN05216245_11062 [Succiniclasticum ruminis DSM 9236]